MSIPISSPPLPTPPFSPSYHSKSCQLPPVDSLITHYQRERMWVKQKQDVIALGRQQQLYGSPRIPISKPNPTGIPLWQRRKSQHSFRLSDLSHTKLSKRLLDHDECGARILDSFAALLEARIESCKRVELLISQSAKRGRLYARH
ncbi:hypothetical protein K439DRAFT_894435 [Ramaria rubella]|nr:hypothetical protein K439DRAFT_894435 [Ramaria rubella]